MSKFTTVALTAAGVAAVGIIGLAASATASTLPMITSSSPAFTSSGSPSPSITPSPTPSVTPSPSISPSPTADPSAITADIYVALGALDDTGPMEFEVIGVVVGDGPELTGDDLVANPSEYCGDVTVDVSLDPTTITVTGGENYCGFQAAYVEVTLHGAGFSSTTVLSDGLFEAGPVDKALSFTGGAYKSRGLHLGAADANPVLDSFGVSGNMFSAYWSGQNWNDMSGASVFGWVPIALAGAGANGNPAFTG